VQPCDPFSTHFELFLRCIPGCFAGCAARFVQVLTELYGPKSSPIVQVDYHVERIWAVDGSTRITTHSNQRFRPSGIMLQRRRIIRKFHENSQGSPAAIANAVVDALWHLGVRHIDIPITPAKVWKILREKGVAE